MTLGLHQWLRLLACTFAWKNIQRRSAPLDLSRLSETDLRDLNLPPDMLCHLAARDADSRRRRVFR